MISWLNGKLMKWQVDLIANWLYGLAMKWQVGSRNGKYMIRQDDEITNL